MSKKILLEVKNLSKVFTNNLLSLNFFSQHTYQKSRKQKVLDNISFSLLPSECIGIFGKSGCGKTTLLFCLARLIEPSEGQIFFDGEDWLGLSNRQLKQRIHKMQMIFQDPTSSLNPYYDVNTILEEPLIINTKLNKHERASLIEQMLEIANLSKNIKHKNIYELSGGQKQRINILRAFILKPKLILADELTSFLDISLQIEILNMLSLFLKEFSSSCIFVSHDLRVLKYLCNKIIFMDNGKIISIISSKDIGMISDNNMSKFISLFEYLKTKSK